MYPALLETGLTIELAKHRAVIAYHASVAWLETTADFLDERYGKTHPCLNNIMCERQGVRHKAGCPGKLESFDTYVKGLAQA